MLCASVPPEPAASKPVIVPSAARTKPCVALLPSVYQPEMEPPSLMLSGQVCTDPAGSKVVYVPFAATGAAAVQRHKAPAPIRRCAGADRMAGDFPKLTIAGFPFDP